MNVNAIELENALHFWRTQASANGWRETHPDFTVWVDSDGHVTDSVGTRDGSDLVHIVGPEEDSISEGDVILPVCDEVAEGFASFAGSPCEFDVDEEGLPISFCETHGSPFSGSYTDSL